MRIIFFPFVLKNTLTKLTQCFNIQMFSEDGYKSISIIYKKIYSVGIKNV